MGNEIEQLVEMVRASIISLKRFYAMASRCTDLLLRILGLDSRARRGRKRVLL